MKFNPLYSIRVAIYAVDKQQLQRFLGLCMKGGTKRARVFRRILKTLSPFPVDRVSELLAVFEKTFAIGFRKFKASKEGTLRDRVKGSLKCFSDGFKNLEPEERKALIGISVYLLLITVTNATGPAMAKVGKAVKS